MCVQARSHPRNDVTSHIVNVYVDMYATQQHIQRQKMQKKKKNQK